MKSRYQAKVDANHGEIVDAFTLAGCSVQDLSRVGQGCPDLLIGCSGENLLVEVKGPKAKLNERRVAWSDRWRGQRIVIRTVEEAVDLVRLTRMKP